MIGQLQKNFNVCGKTIAVSAALLSAPVTAHAENVSAEFVTTDWLIFVKSENSVYTELSRHLQGPAMLVNANATLNLDNSADNFDENYLYILVGNKHDGREPYLVGQLSGDKTIITNDMSISVMESGFRKLEPPHNIVMIEEIITGGFGGGGFAATYPLRNGSPNKTVNGKTLAGAWSQGQGDTGDTHVFRVPYSALLNPPSPPQDTPPSDSGAVNNQGVTVNVDVGGLLGSLFGNKKKKAPKDSVQTPSEETDTVIIDEGSPTTNIQSIDNAETPSNSDPVLITPPTEIITQYVSDPDVLADRDRLLKERTGMLEYIKGLTNVIKERESTIRELRNDLTRAQNGVDSLPALVTPLQEQIKVQKQALKIRKEELTQKTERISNLNDQIKALESRPQPLPIPALIVGGLGLLGLGGLAGLMLGRHRHNRQCEAHIPPLKREEEEREKSQGFESLKKGMAFAASPMLLGGLPPALAAIKPVYDAVGRIGFAQNGKPVGQDESFGTGILISERHILTNRHVWEMFKHRLASDEPTGIEFYGEKESDKTDFINFADTEPVCIDGWDAAIFTLSHSPDNRKPVTITPRPAESLNDLDIVVVGYPQAHRLTEDIAEVTETDPIFGVKRYSEGKIFRHSVDIENPYGVEAAVESVINPSESMRAICHNASTLGGSSGSAVICKKTGELIALHFGFDSAYEWEEAANFAVAGEDLADKVTKITNTVTAITDKPMT